MKIFKSYKNTGRVLAMASLMAVSFGLHAAIPGIESNSIELWAKSAQIPTPDGDSLRIWGFARSAAGEAEYPAPTIIVDEGDIVNVTIHNVDVPQAVSLVFPGQGLISKTCDIPGAPQPTGLNQNYNGCWGNASISGTDVVPADDAGVHSITYTFTAAKPGTYLYQSGVSPQIQADMGLVGAFIVRPFGPIPAAAYMDPTNLDDDGNQLGGVAYNDPTTAYDQEYLFFLSEMDPKLHYLAEHGGIDQWDNSEYRSVLFFINGRNAPDTLAPDNYPYLHHQPLGSLVIMKPGQRILLRVLNPGRSQHPLHLHGNHYDQIARDGNLLATTTREGNTGFSDYTLNSVPGSTQDLIFNWTGEGMGWDIYNSESPHGTCISGAGEDDAVNNRTGQPTPDGFHDITWEYCADHGKPLPVVLPENQDLGFGGFYGGSPYLGDVGSLPVGEGGLNPWGGMVFMWHSHSERALTNNDIFPGGMLTMMIVVPR